MDYGGFLITLMDHVSDPSVTTDHHLDSALNTLKMEREKRERTALNMDVTTTATDASYDEWVAITSELKNRWLETRYLSHLRAWLQVPFPQIT